jgi:hypothetical protein
MSVCSEALKNLTINFLVHEMEQINTTDLACRQDSTLVNQQITTNIIFHLEHLTSAQQLCM